MTIYSTGGTVISVKNICFFVLALVQMFTWRTLIECRVCQLELKYTLCAEMFSVSVGTSSAPHIGSVNVLIVLLAAACPYGGC